MIQYYLRLGLEPGAGFEEIKNSFRQMAKRYHPDAGNGNAIMFARIKEAYDALSNNEQRSQFEKIYQTSSHHQTVWQNLARRISKLREKAGWPAAEKAKPNPETNRQPFRPQEPQKPQASTSQRPTRPAQPHAQDARASSAQEGVITRVMSIAMPRGGQLVLEDIAAQWIIEPTTPETLWETTVKKFGADDLERLSQHVIQLRVTGQRSLARGVELRATDTGVCASPLWENKKDKTNPNLNLFLNPLTIRVTVPLGTRLLLNNLGGTISLGDIHGEVRARLNGRTTLRSGQLSRASLTLRGKSRAILSRLEGEVDVLMTDTSKALLNGRIGRLRAVVEKEGQLEVLAPLGKLHAEVNGRGLIMAKAPVDTVSCNVFGSGHVHIAELRTSIVANTKDQGRVDVRKKPSYMPSSGLHRRHQTGA